MVRDLHAAGLEVVLDVVYNHTAEGGADGPTLSWRGLDNAAYYRLRHGRQLRRRHRLRQHPRPAPPAHACRWSPTRCATGCRRCTSTGSGSTSRRRWRAAATRFEPVGTFFAVLDQDPVLSRVKLIAEPWDVGPGGYQLGGFPPPWAEWNDRYRDTVRESWLGSRDAARRHGGGVRDLAYRLSGSSDVFEASGRGPLASVNFVTAHDGFTLHDLVSYERKHNEANGEDNRDGSDNNRSWNCGVEGTDRRPGGPRPAPPDDAQPAHDAAGVHRRADAHRRRRDRPHPARQQQRLLPGRRDLLAVLGPRPVAAATCSPGPGPCSRCAASTRCCAHDDFFEGRPAHADGIKDLAWFGADGQELTAGALVRPRPAGPRHATSPATRSSTTPRPRRCSCCSTPAVRRDRRAARTARGAAYDVLLDTADEQPTPAAGTPRAPS